MKAGRLGSSFGFLALETSDRGDGVKVIEAIDLFEVSVTAAPANADYRIQGKTIKFRPVIPTECSTNHCREAAAWSITVALPGKTWGRVG
jgi:phage head maturation protease